MENMLDWLDSAVNDTVLIFGRLPPEGRDIDLLARHEDFDAITAELRRKEFIGNGRKSLRFEQGKAEVLELVAADTWNLPPDELDALFAEAVELEGFHRLARPAPHHALLIAARRLAQGGALSEREREKVRLAEAKVPECWELARSRAPLWGADQALERLRARIHAGGSRDDALTHAAHIRRKSIRAFRATLPGSPRGKVVSISGCDGAGKSSQAAALQQALDAVGIEAVVLWRPLADPVVLDLVARPIKKLLRVLRVGPLRDPEVRSVMSSAGDTSSTGGAAAKSVWLSAIALLNALSQRWNVAAHTRRGRLVILDRSSLDAMVLLRFLYGDGYGLGFQRWLLRTMSAPVSLGFFLDVAPEMLLARKQDWWTLDDLRRQIDLYREEHPRFGVRRLDGELEQDQISTTIAVETWRLVAGG